MTNIIVPQDIPAIDTLKKEGISVASKFNIDLAKIKPLRIIVLNLMPLKITAETDFIRVLSNVAYPISVEFMMLNTHISKHTPKEHVDKFYNLFSEVKDQQFDGLIITGSPVEKLDFEDVSYWDELKEILDWSKANVVSTIYLCWGAQAALYYFYGIKKLLLDRKLSGVFKHQLSREQSTLTRGFDSEFYVPHSRYTAMDEEGINNEDNLRILAKSEEAGASVLVSQCGKEIYLTGHSEYPMLRLNEEYVRDINKGMDIHLPENYYQNGDTAQPPLYRWSAHGYLFYNNWVNHILGLKQNK